MGRHLSKHSEPSTHSRVKRKRGDSIHKEQLWKSEVYFTQISPWWDLLTWWKCKRLYLEIRGVTSVLTGSVCIRLERFGISQTWLCASQMHSAPVLHFCLPSNGNFQGFLTEWKHMSGSHDRACFCEYVAECFGSGSRSRSKNLLGMWAWF